MIIIYKSSCLKERQAGFLGHVDHKKASSDVKDIAFTVECCLAMRGLN